MAKKKTSAPKTIKVVPEPRNRQLKEKDNRRLQELQLIFPGEITEAEKNELNKLENLKAKYG